MEGEGIIKTIGRYSYFTQKCLGEGSFGKVFEGYENTSREKVAIKKVDFKTIEKDSYLEKAIHDQIKILSKFKHPNIVQLREVLNSKRSLYIIMDYCKDGDLKRYLKIKRKLSEEEAFQVMRQIITGYRELAKQKTIHRDLKPANILINDGLFKICDFGFSKVIKDPNTSLKTCVGSPIYMAPQILQKNYYSAKCDIWSLGVIYYEMLNGTVPWTARSQKQLLANIKKHAVQFQASCPKSKKIVSCMLEVNQQKRASLQDLQAFFGIEQANTTITNVTNIQNQSISQNTVNQTSFTNDVSSLQPSIVPRLQSGTTINTRVINRNYFEQLSFRYFVCTEIKSKLSHLNRYNFTKNIFQRLLVLIITSVLSNFKKRRAEIERIHDKQALQQIMRQYEFYNQFKDQLFEYLNNNYVTCQVLKQFELSDIALCNFTQQVMKKSQKLLYKIAMTIINQVNEQLKIMYSQSQHEPADTKIMDVQKNVLNSIGELIIDMILLNQKQAKTGIADIGIFMKDRKSMLADKRIALKTSLLKNISATQFF